MTQRSITLSIVTDTDKHWGQAYAQLSSLALSVSSTYPQTTLSSIDLSDTEEIEEIHDEGTMTKVHNALRHNNFSESGINDIINSLQNAGILFREIKPS